MAHKSSKSRRKFKKPHREFPLFTEFDTIVRELDAKSILELLKKYPTPARIARARLNAIKSIPHLRVKTACRLHEAARETIASLKGPVAEMRVRTLVDQVRYARKLKCQYEQLLVETYRSLPITNHLDSWYWRSHCGRIDG